jgi:hypothetical protein
MPEHGSQGNRGHGEQCQFPEITTSLEARPAKRLDQLNDHETDDDKGEKFRHAAFDQQRARLSKHVVHCLRKNDAAIPGRNAAPACGWQTIYFSGLRPASIEARFGSRNGGKARLSPSVSSGSSAVKPGPSVAISNRMPFGSRK